MWIAARNPTRPACLPGPLDTRHILSTRRLQREAKVGWHGKSRPSVGKQKDSSGEQLRLLNVCGRLDSRSPRYRPILSYSLYVQGRATGRQEKCELISR